MLGSTASIKYGTSFSVFSENRRAFLRPTTTSMLSLVHRLQAPSLHQQQQPQQRWLSSSTSYNEPNLSKRAAFKSRPVDPKILDYIERIGVGIPQRWPRRKRQRRPSRKKRPPRKHDTTVLDTEEELEFFRQKLRNAAVSEKRPRKYRAAASNIVSNDADGSSNSVATSWLPPPPFASTPTGAGEPSSSSNEESARILGKSSSSSAAGPEEASAFDYYKVKRHPVKVIGWVSSVGERFPTNNGLPEVALAGRSNVGKSTLLNALLYGNQDTIVALAKQAGRRRGKVPDRMKVPKGVKAVTSDRPGETRKITFYRLSSDVVYSNDTMKDSVSMSLVDLPGYGFAYASEDKAQEWKELMKDYILHRGKSLKRVLLLLDARHGMKKADRDFLDNLQSLLYSEAEQDDGKKRGRRELPPIQLVLTKCDLVSQHDLARRVVQVRDDLSDCLRREPSALPVMLVSAKPGVGFNNVRGDRALGGVLELQREIAALAPRAAQQPARST